VSTFALQSIYTSIMLLHLSLAALVAIAGLASATAVDTTTCGSQTHVNTTTCGGQTYVYQQLAGYGYIASHARDKFGDTLGGFGSAIAIDKNTWKKQGQTYTGILWALPGESRSIDQ
jgi:hypothetical protein